MVTQSWLLFQVIMALVLWRIWGFPGLLGGLFGSWLYWSW